jgi:phosphoesterase RecJ-like protein
MIYSQAIAGRWPITPDAATCLYTAILTDTGRFTFPNTTASCLHAAGALVELGAQHILAAEKTYQETTPGLLSLRAEALGTIRMYASDRIAVMSITHDMMARNRVDPIDTQEMADYPRSITGVAVGVLLREMRKQGKVKVSLRSRYGIDVEPVARKFGGGGHHEAAGCEVPGDMETVGTWVVEELTRRLREQGMT